MHENMFPREIQKAICSDFALDYFRKALEKQVHNIFLIPFRPGNELEELFLKKFVKLLGALERLKETALAIFFSLCRFIRVGGGRR